MKKKQDIYVGCIVPEKGKPSIGVMVLGQEEDLAKTFIVLCSGGNPIEAGIGGGNPIEARIGGGNPIEARPVDVYELNWPGLPTQKVGYVRMFIDPTYLNLELSVYSCFLTSDSEDIWVKSRPFRFRM